MKGRHTFDVAGCWPEVTEIEHVNRESRRRFSFDSY